MDYWYFVSAFIVAFIVLGSLALNVADRCRKRKRAAPSASAGSTEREKLYALADAIEVFVEKSAHPRELLEQPDFKAATELLKAKSVTFDVLRQYATGASWPLACAALFVLSQRPEYDSLSNAIIQLLPQMRPWTIFFALRYLASLKERPPVGAPAARAQLWWRDNLVIPDSFAEYFTARAKLGDPVTFGDTLDKGERSEMSSIDWLLYRVDHPSASVLRADLKLWSASHIDRTFLSTVGRFWTEAKEDELLVSPDDWRDRLIEATAAIIQSSPRRSLLVSGESRVGKTSFLKLAARMLGGWTIFEASAAELMAGQTYFGQLEGRVRQVVKELDSAKNIAWYVPDLLQLAEAGMHQGQSASILDQVIDEVNKGRLVILSETTPAATTRLFQRRPSLRGALEVVRLEPMTEEETAALVKEIAPKVKDVIAVQVTPTAVETVLHLSHQYLGTTQLPGVTIDLMKRAANHAVGVGAIEVGSEDVLETLSQTSGLPRSILDDNQRLDLKSVRDQFEKSVIGQDEAVGAVVGRIAMLKAGLGDPRRPIGVFLFAGPTGTGKTELAKTLATYLFGSPDRMARLDMSELQTAESTVKIVGSTGTDTDSLADKIRKQPFSVILLDEFEKAHSNAWDLFLQVFDDGRLTDANGRTVDFRHTIIVLTTNLGATTHKASAIGFARGQGAYAPDQIFEAVSRTFRPEFVNRLDKIIVFRPLSRELMRRILEKELSLVLERRGLRQRDWAVEWEDSAIAFLLDKGFTPDMGARPLKRAIDEHLLAPLAATMVEHRYPEGDQFLFVRSDGKAIQVEFVDPNADEALPLSSDASLGAASIVRAILMPSASKPECSALAAEMAAIDAKLSGHDWNAKRDALSAAINDAGVWQRKDRATIFTRFEQMDRVLEAKRTAERLNARLEASRGRGGASRELVSRLALQLHLVGLGIDDALTNAPVDALVAVDLSAGDAGAETEQAWCSQVAAMYRGWAQKRHARLKDIVPASESGAARLEITGFGVFRTLSEEAGLHVLERPGGTRAVARVRVAAGPIYDVPERERSQALLELLKRASENATIVRRYRREPDRLVRDAKTGWRSGKLEQVLAGDFDLIGMLKEQP